MTARDRPRLRIVAAATAVALWSAGCGSTVQQQGVAADGLAPGAVAQDSPSAGLAAPFEGTGTAAGGPSGAQAGGSGSAATAPAIAAGATAIRPGVTDSGAGAPSESSPDGGAAAAVAPAPADAAPAPGAGGPIPADHPGVEGDVVRVGLLYLANAGSLASAFGVQGYSQGDEPGEFAALVADVNARGGLGGRQVEIVVHDLGGVDDSAFEAACARFTQDEPVYLVFSGLGHSPTFGDCLARAGVGHVSSVYAPPQRRVDEIGYAYAPDSISVERFTALLGQSLLANGFFGEGAVVGLIRVDDPDEERVTREILEPTLAQAGLTIAREEVISDATTAVSGAPGRAFRLRAAGVTHVITYGTPLFEMIAAESQDWRPAWSVTTRAGPGGFLEGSAPEEQLRRAAGPGWEPVADLNAHQLEGPVSDEEVRCDAVLRDAGYELTGAPRTIAMYFCGALTYSQEALRRADVMTAEGFRVAAETLGTSLVSPSTFRLDFVGGRHDGVAAYRYLAWDEACGCFGYTTEQQPTP